MLYSKRSSLLALTVIAAVAVEVGCGDGGHGDKRSMSHTLKGTTAAPNSGAKKSTLNTPQNSTTDKASKSQIESQENQLRAYPTLAKEQIPAGTYTLNTMQTIVHYTKTQPAEGLDASITDTLDYSNAQGVTFSPASPIVSGSMATSVDKQRDFVFPTQFSSNATERYTEKQTVTVHTYWNQAKKLIDETRDAGIDSAASISRILSANQTSGSDSDKQYIGKTDDGVAIYLRILQVSKTSLRLYVSFEEEPATNSATETKHRNIYLDYTLKPDAAPAATTGTPAATATPAQNDAGPAAAPAPSSAPAPQGPINNNLPPSTDSSGTIQQTAAPNSTVGG